MHAHSKHLTGQHLSRQFPPQLGRWALWLLLALSAPAWAITLDDAKSSGRVGETASGYLGIVEPPGTHAVQDLVAEVNRKRRQEYERIAAANGIAVTDVERLAAQKAIGRTPAGQWIQLPDGAWRRK